MKEDFSELIEYLDKKFQETASKENLATFASKDDLMILGEKFITLEEFDQFRAETKQEFADLKVAIQHLTNSIDKLVKVVSDLRIEYAAVSHQLSRHEKWIQQIAGKIGVRLDY